MRTFKMYALRNLQMRNAVSLAVATVPRLMPQDSLTF